jgi:hypothetical protein
MIRIRRSREDVERQPDGVPHRIVGLAALFSVLIAILVAGIFVSGGTVGRVGAVLLALIAIPVLVSILGRKARRERDHVHPSR